MRKIKLFLVRSGAVVGGLVVAVQANAASVLDADAKTAITAGFADMKDTTLDLLSTYWPFFLGMIALMFAPKLLSRLVKKV